MSSYKFFLLPLALPYPCPGILASPYANPIFLWELGRGIKADPVTGATLGGAGGADVRPRGPPRSPPGWPYLQIGCQSQPCFYREVHNFWDSPVISTGHPTRLGPFICLLAAVQDSESVSELDHCHGDQR